MDFLSAAVSADFSWRVVKPVVAWKQRINLQSDGLSNNSWKHRYAPLIVGWGQVEVKHVIPAPHSFMWDDELWFLRLSSYSEASGFVWSLQRHSRNTRFGYRCRWMERQRRRGAGPSSRGGRGWWNPQKQARDCDSVGTFCETSQGYSVCVCHRRWTSLISVRLKHKEKLSADGAKSFLLTRDVLKQEVVDHNSWHWHNCFKDSWSMLMTGNTRHSGSHRPVTSHVRRYCVLMHVPIKLYLSCWTVELLTDVERERKFIVIIVNELQIIGSWTFYVSLVLMVCFYSP